MRKSTYSLAVAIATMALAMSAAPRAEDAAKPPPGEGGRKSMMGQAGQMMDHCDRMMRSARTDSGRPNEQWRDGAPPASGKTDKKQ